MLRLRVEPHEEADVLEILDGLADVQAVTREGHEIEVTGTRRVLPAVVLALAEVDIVPDVRTVTRSLEDVFVHVTGRTYDHMGRQAPRRPTTGPTPKEHRDDHADGTTPAGDSTPTSQDRGYRLARPANPDPDRGPAAAPRPGDGLLRSSSRPCCSWGGLRDPRHAGGHHRRPAAMGGLTAVAVYVPVALAMAMATVALTTMPVYFATFREKGVLRRLSTTPMRPQGLIGAHLFINLVMVCVAALLAVLVGGLVFDLAMPANLVIVLAAFLLGVLSMFSLGMLIASRAAKASTASAIGMTLYFPMLFLAGCGRPDRSCPMHSGRSGIHAARRRDAGHDHGVVRERVPVQELVVMAVWTLVLLPLAARLFRWS
ncbi:ABC transporter permease [Oerskovia sp. M15]